MHLVIFEGEDFASLAPLSFFRPTFCLRSGATTLLAKQLRVINPSRLSLWVRPQLAEFCRRAVIPNLLPALRETVTINQPLDDQPAILCDGRTFLTTSQGLDNDMAITSVTQPGLTPDDASKKSERFCAISAGVKTESAPLIARRVWDLLTWNEQSLQDDIQHLRDRLPNPRSGSFHLVQESDIFVGDNVKLQPGCVIDASAGPVYLADGVIIGANSVVLGPCAIGDHSEIAPLTTVRPRTSVGPWCKLGGEVSATIIQGFSNKAHDGYLGDSYLGEWVNLGAGTMTSNLKNTYGRVSMHADGTQMDSGRRFLGSIVGDHSKTGIGTRLMTGTYIGVCSMVASSASPPRFVPSFQFRTDNKSETYRLEKAIEVARFAYGRRNVTLHADDEAVIRAAAMWSYIAEEPRAT